MIEVWKEFVERFRYLADHGADEVLQALRRWFFEERS